MVKKISTTKTDLNQLPQIIESKFEDDQINSVDARELHSFLGSKSHFSIWVRKKVVDNPFFEEGVDYILLNQLVVQKQRGGHNKKDYALTLDTAKKVSMSEQTEKGEEARNHFLKCEKIALHKVEPQQLEKKEIIEVQMIGIKYCKELLNHNDASTLQLMHKAFRDNNISTAALPEYVESKDVMFSASQLLKEIEAAITTQTFNKLMIKAGYLEIKKRLKANKKDIKKFKALTEKGMYYGENVTAPQNKLEVSPRYFESKFGELYDKLLKLR